MTQDVAIRKLMEEMIKSKIISPLDFIPVQRYLEQAYTIGWENCLSKPKLHQINLRGETVAVFDNPDHANRETGIRHQCIYKVIHGKRRTAGRFTWKDV